MSVRVRIDDLVLHGRHGALPEETALGQRFHVDIEVLVDVEEAIASDDVADAVDYGALCAIAAEVSATPVRLIETLAARIGDAVLARFALVEEARVTVRKPAVPLPYALRHAAAEVTRVRSTEVAFSLGSNVGDPRENLRRAVAALAAVPGVTLGTVSHLYGTAPWGGVAQDPFVNACAVGTTRLSPQRLLAACKALEVALGRTPEARWGPRVIDVDVLHYGDRRVASDLLTLPHRELFARAFVLVPLAEIAPDRVIGDATVAEHLARLTFDPADVVRL